MKYYCYDNYSKDLHLRNLQIVYLYYIEDLKPSQIAEIVGLAPSTVTNYRNKYYEMLNEAEEMFTSTTPKKIMILNTIMQIEYLQTQTAQTNFIY